MDWNAERREVLHEDHIGDLEPDEVVYAELVLTACQEAIDGPYNSIDLLVKITSYDGELLDAIGAAVMAMPTLGRARRAMLFGALKMAQAYIYTNTPVDDD